jgi:hypothetical protein
MKSNVQCNTVFKKDFYDGRTRIVPSLRKDRGKISSTRSSVADPGPGSGAFLTPWIRDAGWLKSQNPDPG